MQDRTQDEDRQTLEQLLRRPYSSRPLEKVKIRIHPDLIDALHIIAEAKERSLDQIVDEVVKSGCIAKASADEAFRAALQEADETMQQQQREDDVFMRDLRENPPAPGFPKNHEDVVRELRQEGKL